MLRTSGLIDLGDHTVACQTLDLSERGLGLLAPVAAPSRSVRVRFRLAEWAPWTDVDGRVVRNQRLEDRGPDGPLVLGRGPDGPLVLGRGPDGPLELWGLELHAMDLGTMTRLRDFIRANRD